MSIRRGPSPADNFAQISNAALRDKRLSWKARGLLAYLLSHSEEWQTSVSRLMKEGPDGRDSIRAGLAELIDLGYLVRSKDRQRSAAGTLLDYDYTAFHYPESDYPTLGKPTLDNPHPKKTISKKTKKQEHQSVNGPAGGSKPTDDQLDYLRDLHLHGGGKSPDEIEPFLSGLATVADADREIKEANAILGRGRHYEGDPDSPGFTAKGREVAARKLVPRGVPDARS